MDLFITLFSYVYAIAPSVEETTRSEVKDCMGISAYKADQIARQLSAAGRGEEAADLRTAVVDYFEGVEYELSRYPYEASDAEIEEQVERDWDMWLRDEHLHDRDINADDLSNHAINHQFLDEDTANHVINEMSLLIERWAVLGAKGSEGLVQIILAKLFGADTASHQAWLGKVRDKRTIHNPRISSDVISDFIRELRSLLARIAESPLPNDVDPQHRAVHVRYFTDMLRGKNAMGQSMGSLRDLTADCARLALFSGFGRGVGEWIEELRQEVISDEASNYDERIKNEAQSHESDNRKAEIREELERRDEEAGASLGLGTALLDSWKRGSFAEISADGEAKSVSPDCPAYRVDIDAATRLLSEIYGDHASLNPFRDVLATAEQGRGKVAELVQKAGIR